MKKTSWFKHDWNARRNPKIKKLFKKFGVMGYGSYFMLLEILYECGGEMELDIEILADEMRENESIIKSIIEDFGLFTITENILSSDGVKERFEEMKRKSQIGKNAVDKREEYRKQAKDDSDALGF